MLYDGQWEFYSPETKKQKIGCKQLKELLNCFLQYKQTQCLFHMLTLLGYTEVRLWGNRLSIECWQQITENGSSEKLQWSSSATETKETEIYTRLVLLHLYFDWKLQFSYWLSGGISY